MFLNKGSKLRDSYKESVRVQLLHDYGPGFCSLAKTRIIGICRQNVPNVTPQLLCIHKRNRNQLPLKKPLAGGAC